MVRSVILFAKAPVPGRVKTRLVPPLSPELAARLHIAFVSDLLQRFSKLAHWSLELHTDIPTDAWREFIVSRQIQSDGDLGKKMLSALRPGATIVGTDAPTVPVEHLEKLPHVDADIVLGPAEDGGYYAIYARRVHPLMFADVDWSRRDTLAQTQRALERCGLTFACGPMWWDVDEPADLARLAACTDLPPHTAALLEQLDHTLDSLKLGADLHPIGGAGRERKV